LAGTIAERYLREHRGITAPLPKDLRFLPYAHAGWRAPGLIAAVRDLNDQITAVQCGYLDPNTGQKANVHAPRKIFGRMRNGAVRLGEPEAGRLGLAEGVETALSAAEILGIPTWATLNVKRLARIALPPEVQEVHIMADINGIEEANQACNLYLLEGYRVFLHRPHDAKHKDFNDLLCAKERNR
jgi:hypothetical protein